MNARKFLFRSLAICAGLTLAFGPLVARALAAAVRAKPTGEIAFKDVDAYLAKQLYALNIPGAALAVIEGNEIVHVQGFGAAAPGGEAPTAQTPFMIGSLTKSFTALAVMHLVEAGKVELDAPVQRYLPWFRIADPAASAQITVRHLLNQSSGFSQPAGLRPLANADAAPDAAERQARALASYRLPRPVGAAFEYSNVNFNLLGLIVEAASGERYADYVQAHIFAPLDMARSYTARDAARQNGLAIGHQHWFGTPVAVPAMAEATGSLPSSGLAASAEDMAHYLIAILNRGEYAGRRILSAEGVAKMLRPAVDVNTTGLAGSHYGMGWFVTEAKRGLSIWHHGSMPDFVSYMELLPELNRGLVLLVNVNHTATMFAVPEVAGGAASLLAGEEPEPVPWAIVPWSMRTFLLIPLCQIVGVRLTWRLLRRWRRELECRPGRTRLWLLHIVPSLAINLLLVAAAIGVLASGMLPFLLLFMADLAWLALISGGFALVWSVARTWLILSTVRGAPAPEPAAGLPAAQAGALGMS